MKRHLTYASKFARARHFAGIRAAQRARQQAAEKQAVYTRYGIVNPPQLGQYLYRSNLGLEHMARALGAMS